MNNQKIVITTLVVATIIGTNLIMPANTYAVTSNASPVTSLIERIAARFGLKAKDVQNVADQMQNERQQQKTQELENKLTQLVGEGKITEAQKQLLIAKHQELQAEHAQERVDMSGKTFAERKAGMEARRTEKQKEREELEAWAKQNGIDPQYLFGNMGMGEGKGMGFGRGMHNTR